MNTTTQDPNAILAKATCLHDQAAVAAALDRMAEHLTTAVGDANPVILGVMIGALVPLGCLLPRLAFALTVDYVHATRYQSGVSGGTLTWLMKAKTPLQGRTVVVFDDILDGGVTLQAIVDECQKAGAARVLTAVLVDKQVAREPGGLATADVVGLTVGDHYVFGFGLDYQETLRNAPGIYALP